MLIPFSQLSELPACDVCVVGAGPVGIALAQGCAREGLSVLLLESGFEHPDRFAATLGTGHRTTMTHAAPNVAASRGLGGTSRWWGGRCVPFDEIDFAERPHASAATWPIPHDEISRWYSAAAEFFGVGPARFESSAAGWTDIGDVRFDQLERWTPEINMGQRQRFELANSSAITVVLGATVTAITLSDDGRYVANLMVSAPGKTVLFRPHDVVLACGGLETTRLLLTVQRRWPDALGGRDGPLGRGYMGHISGKISSLSLADPTTAPHHDFFLDDGAFARRRFTIRPEAQQRHELLNIAFWADNPPFHWAGHGNGALSLVWLALAIPPIGRRLVSEAVRQSHVGPRPKAWMRHFANMLGSPASTAREIGTILWARTLSRPRKPGFLMRSSDGRYCLHYHAEHAPHDDSRVTLSQRTDALGLAFLDIDLRYTEADARSALAAHELLDQSLRRAGLAQLEYFDTDISARIASISRQASDGFHQIGTTRMGTSPQHSVVDPHCRAHDIENLHVASTSVLPSSGQANPTFVAVALALRLAGRLAARGRYLRTEAA